MILGRIAIDPAGRTLHTHRDSYRLDGLSVVSVRRPFLPAGVAVAFLAGGFGLRFADLLYPDELVTVAGIAGLALLLGTQIGRLSLLSRDLRGSPLAEVLCGRTGSLQAVRRRIAAATLTERSTS